MAVGDEILAAMPYARPFLFVDSIDEVSDEAICGRYRFREDELFYAGHFPGRPVTPGVILIETMAQIGLVSLGIYLTRAHLSPEGSDTSTSRIAFTESNVVFLSAVFPGDEVTVRARRVYFRLGKLKCEVWMTNASGERVSEGTMAGMILDRGTQS